MKKEPNIDIIIDISANNVEKSKIPRTPSNVQKPKPVPAKPQYTPPPTKKPK